MLLLLRFQSSQGPPSKCILLDRVDSPPLLLDDLSHLVGWSCGELAEDVGSQFVRELLEDSLEHGMVLPLGLRRSINGRSIGGLL